MIASPRARALGGLLNRPLRYVAFQKSLYAICSRIGGRSVAAPRAG